MSFGAQIRMIKYNRSLFELKLPNAKVGQILELNDRSPFKAGVKVEVLSFNPELDADGYFTIKVMLPRTGHTFDSLSCYLTDHEC